MSGILAKYPDPLKGVSYDYGDAFVGAMRAFEATGKKLDIVATVEDGRELAVLRLEEGGQPELQALDVVAVLLEA